MTNKNKTVLYVGVTSDLKNRIGQYRNHVFKNSFTDKYNIELLIYYEGFDNIEEAIIREKVLKRYNRSRKEELINSVNNNWNDLYNEVMNDIYSLL